MSATASGSSASQPAPGLQTANTGSGQPSTTTPTPTTSSSADPNPPGTSQQHNSGNPVQPNPPQPTGTATGTASQGGNEEPSSKFWTFMERQTNLTNTAIGIVVFVLTIIGYRYMKWTAKHDFRDDCRAVAASNQTVSKECQRALMGSMTPPPFRKRSTDCIYCTKYYCYSEPWSLHEDLIAKFVQSELATGKPTLWENLLFIRGNMPEKPLFITAYFALPALIGLFLVPFLFRSKDKARLPGLTIAHIFAGYGVYIAVGLTGVWEWLTKILFAGITWSMAEVIERGSPEGNLRLLYWGPTAITVLGIVPLFYLMNTTSAYRLVIPGFVIVGSAYLVVIASVFGLRLLLSWSGLVSIGWPALIVERRLRARGVSSHLSSTGSLIYIVAVAALLVKIGFLCFDYCPQDQILRDYVCLQSKSRVFSAYSQHLTRALEVTEKNIEEGLVLANNEGLTKILKSALEDERMMGDALREGLVPIKRWLTEHGHIDKEEWTLFRDEL